VFNPCQCFTWRKVARLSLPFYLSHIFLSARVPPTFNGALIKLPVGKKEIKRRLIPNLGFCIFFLFPKKVFFLQSEVDSSLLTYEQKNPLLRTRLHFTVNNLACTRVASSSLFTGRTSVMRLFVNITVRIGIYSQ
jgi:hypothetical protein